MIAAFLKIILLIMEGVRDARHRQKREQYEHNIQRIKDDPIAEWNKRFPRRVRGARERESNSLPAIDPEPPSSGKRDSDA